MPDDFGKLISLDEHRARKSGSPPGVPVVAVIGACLGCGEQAVRIDCDDARSPMLMETEAGLVAVATCDPCGAMAEAVVDASLEFGLSSFRRAILETKAGGGGSRDEVTARFLAAYRRAREILSK